MASSSYSGHPLCMVGIPQKPIITGYKSSLREKETTTLNCQSSGSKPAANLTWQKGEQELHGKFLLPWGYRRRWYWREERREGGVHVYIHTRHAVEGKSRMTFCAHLCVYVCAYPFHNFLSLCKLKFTVFMTNVGPTQYL